MVRGLDPGQREKWRYFRGFVWRKRKGKERKGKENSCFWFFDAL